MRQCVEISRSWNLELRIDNGTLVLPFAGPDETWKPAGCLFSGPSATTPFTVAKKSPRSRRLDSFIHAFVGSMTRRRERGGKGTDRADWMTTSPDEKSESKNRASTIRLSAFRPAQRRPVLLTIGINLKDL